MSSHKKKAPPVKGRVNLTVDQQHQQPAAAKKSTAAVAPIVPSLSVSSSPQVEAKSNELPLPSLPQQHNLSEATKSKKLLSVSTSLPPSPRSEQKNAAAIPTAAATPQTARVDGSDKLSVPTTTSKHLQVTSNGPPSPRTNQTTNGSVPTSPRTQQNAAAAPPSPRSNAALSSTVPSPRRQPAPVESVIQSSVEVENHPAPATKHSPKKLSKPSLATANSLTHSPSTTQFKSSQLVGKKGKQPQHTQNQKTTKENGKKLAANDTSAVSNEPSDLTVSPAPNTSQPPTVVPSEANDKLIAAGLVAKEAMLIAQRAALEVERLVAEQQAAVPSPQITIATSATSPSAAKQKETLHERKSSDSSAVAASIVPSTPKQKKAPVTAAHLQEKSPAVASSPSHKNQPSATKKSRLPQPSFTTTPIVSPSSLPLHTIPPVAATQSTQSLSSRTREAEEVAAVLAAVAEIEAEAKKEQEERKKVSAAVAAATSQLMKETSEDQVEPALIAVPAQVTTKTALTQQHHPVAQKTEAKVRRQRSRGDAVDTTAAVEKRTPVAVHAPTSTVVEKRRKQSPKKQKTKSESVVSEVKVESTPTAQVENQHETDIAILTSSGDSLTTSTTAAPSLLDDKFTTPRNSSLTNQSASSPTSPSSPLTSSATSSNAVAPPLSSSPGSGSNSSSTLTTAATRHNDPSAHLKKLNSLARARKAAEALANAAATGIAGEEFASTETVVAAPSTVPQTIASQSHPSSPVHHSHSPTAGTATAKVSSPKVSSPSHGATTGKRALLRRRLAPHTPPNNRSRTGSPAFTDDTASPSRALGHSTSSTRLRHAKSSATVASLPDGITAADVARKDLHDALSLCSKLSQLVGLLQLSVSASKEGERTLSQKDLYELQIKLKDLAERAEGLQTYKKQQQMLNQYPTYSSSSPHQVTRHLTQSQPGAFVRSSASKEALLRINSTHHSHQLSSHARTDSSSSSIATSAKETKEEEDQYFAWPPLDYSRISAVLHAPSTFDGGNSNDADEQSSRQKSSLLQALRLRLTRTPKELRRRHLMEYVRQDILACRRKSDNRVSESEQDEESPSLLSSLAHHTTTQHELARFLNLLASSSIGRRYLLSSASGSSASHSSIVEVLFSLLICHRADTPTRQHALAAMQKLSLTRSAQNRMIQLGLMDWCAKYVLQPAATDGIAAASNSSDTTAMITPIPPPSISSYSLEYGTALLMNLSLRTAGKIRVEKSLPSSSTSTVASSSFSGSAPAIDLISSLLVCLPLDTLSPFRTYLNGTLYSLLSRKKIRQHAREIGVEQVVTDVKQKADVRVQQQCEHILKLLSGNEKSDFDVTAVSESDSNSTTTVADDTTVISEDEDETSSTHDVSSSALLASEVDDGEDALDMEDASSALDESKEDTAGEVILQVYYLPSANQHQDDAAYTSIDIAPAQLNHHTSTAVNASSGVALASSSSSSKLSLNLSSFSDPSTNMTTSFPPIQSSSRFFDVGTPSQTPRHAHSGSNGNLSISAQAGPLVGSSAYFIGMSTTPMNASAENGKKQQQHQQLPNVEKTKEQQMMRAANGKQHQQQQSSLPQQNRYPPSQVARANVGMGKSPSAPVLNPLPLSSIAAVRHPSVIASNSSPPQSHSSRLLPPPQTQNMKGPLIIPPLPVGERRIPLPASHVGEDANTQEKESLTRYYKAFATRAKVGRTPISSAFAEPGEFER